MRHCCTNDRAYRRITALTAATVSAVKILEGDLLAKSDRVRFSTILKQGEVPFLSFSMPLQLLIELTVLQVPFFTAIDVHSKKQSAEVILRSSLLTACFMSFYCCIARAAVRLPAS